MMGGSHRQTSTLRQRKKGAVGRLHSAQSRYRTRPRQKGGAHRQASSPGQWGLLAAATPHGAASGLARDGGRHAPTNFRRVPDVATPRGAAPGLARNGGRRVSACIHARARGVGRRHTTRSRYRTRPQGGRRAPTPPARCHPGSCQARRRRSQGSSSRWSCRAPPLGSTCNVEAAPRGGGGLRQPPPCQRPGPWPTTAVLLRSGAPQWGQGRQHHRGAASSSGTPRWDPRRPPTSYRRPVAAAPAPRALNPTAALLRSRAPPQGQGRHQHVAANCNRRRRVEAGRRRGGTA
jgi:hypothetical protein